MTSALISLNLENYEKCLGGMMSHLAGKIFNVLTMSEGKNLKYCNRKLGERVLLKNGQVSVSLKPGVSIAWDLNVEVAELEWGINGDILLSRTFKSGRKKTMLITLSPI